MFALFILLSLPLAWLSRRSLARPRAHGLYRFLAWELMLALFCLQWRYWFAHPLGLRQVGSWILLFASIPLALAGARQLGRCGAASADSRTEESGLFRFERTTSLVTTGIYRYIRHPLYASLLALTWGMLLKHPGAPTFALAGGATILLFFTARLDEAECRRYFGEEYVRYLARTRMFVPFII